VFDQETRIGNYWERIERGAFKDALERDDVRALFNHDDGQLLGRSSAGTLRMHEDENGLAVEIDLPNTQLGDDVLELVKRGDITGMSFGFVPGEEDWETRSGEQVRIHRSIGTLIDVSPVTFPAYPGTDVSVRKAQPVMTESRAMSAEEIVAALEEIIAQAKDSETGEEAPLTEEQAERYEQLEKQLAAIQKSDEIRSRHAAATQIERPVVAHVENTEKSDEFRSYLVTGEKRGQTVGTPAAGGYTVPETWANELLKVIETYGGLAAHVRTISTDSGNVMHFPARELDQNKAEIVAEGAGPVSGADLEFSQKLMGAFTYQSAGANGEPFRVTRELLQDSAFNIEGELKDVAGERIARALADDLVAGNGTSAPEGITTSTGPAATFEDAELSYAELVAATHKIDPAYRRNAVWVVNDATVELLEQMTDANGRPLLKGSHEGIAEGAGLKLLGYPVIVDQAFADFEEASGNVFGVFGDLKEGYMLRNVKATEVLTDPYTAMQTREVLYTAFARFDGKIRNPYAFALLKNDAA